MYLNDDAIGFDPAPALHIKSLVFPGRHDENIVRVWPANPTLGTTDDSLGHSVSSSYPRCDLRRLRGLLKEPVPAGVCQLRSLIGSNLYYRKFLRNLSKRLKPSYELVDGSFLF